MPEYKTPGVYVEEFDSGSVPMEGVSTSTAGFIGCAQRGPTVGVPQLVTSFNDFRRIYGSYLSENQYGDSRYLSYAVEHFFLNGGGRCFVMRVVPADAVAATNLTEENKETLALHVEAKNQGAWGNQVRVVIGSNNKAKTKITALVEDGQPKYQLKSADGFFAGDIVVYTDAEGNKQYNKVVFAKDDVITLAKPLEGDVVDTDLIPKKTIQTCEFSVEAFYGDEAEKFENLSFNVESPHYVVNVLGKSNLIAVEDLFRTRPETEEVQTPFQVITGRIDDGTTFDIVLTQGTDGNPRAMVASDFNGVDNGPGKRTGLASFVDNDEVAILAIPGITDPNVQLNLVAHCENLKSRFAVLDLPKETTKIEDVKTHRNYFDSSYAALYGPWLQVFDPLEKRSNFIPPSGSVVGIYSRSDTTRGVHKAPANEVVRNCTGLYCQYNNAEQASLNPIGVNLIRSFTGQGIRVWGARTLSSNGLWKYINVRRLFIFVEQSTLRGTNWVVFEPNDEPLWARVHRTMDVFLTGVWRSGALVGAAPGEGFYINIGRTTMTQDDIDNGRLICEIGIAPVKPAEFVIFRFTQKTSDN
ncbi:hypothetical protein EV586_101197 [Tumebacillus sp. BK434]|uniref:phage tail sheath family protein n=1 Tax=Tumebacillus sp. BK434 TaxID=2512169 RepID=UPI0010487392|nr:phage tail sheath subtilisin-like domain-containing protein [Tumebacillus sp. BK434]TCP58998.1 hypothetical protein EV586_101197 [Tumebacillus sp. BK434]